MVNVAPRQHLDIADLFHILPRYCELPPIGRMIARFLRLAIVSMMLLSALVSGAAAQEFLCGEYGDAAAQHTSTGHHSHQGVQGGDEPDRSDGVFHEALGCHTAGSGCAGCLVPFDLASAAPSVGRISYPLSDQLGRSIELADNFRPPIRSL